MLDTSTHEWASPESVKTSPFVVIGRCRVVYPGKAARAKTLANRRLLVAVDGDGAALAGVERMLRRDTGGTSVGLQLVARPPYLGRKPYDAETDAGGEPAEPGIDRTLSGDDLDVPAVDEPAAPSAYRIARLGRIRRGLRP